MTIAVLIADDEDLMRAGLRMILEKELDMVVVGEAADGAAAVDATLRLNPDVVLMDIRMPGLDGIEATRRLVEAGSAAKVVMLTTFDVDDFVRSALRIGASGFVLKDMPPESLVAGIRAVASGESLLAPSITRRLIAEFVKGPTSPTPATQRALESLTARETVVLRLIAEGLSNAEIADQLYLSATTVKTHVGRILMKLDLRDRVQAVVLAHQIGLVGPQVG